MEYSADRTFFETLQELGPVPAVAALVPTICTIWLLTSRVRDWRRVREPAMIRDLACLLSGPVCAVITSIMLAASVTKAAFQTDDPDRWILSSQLDDLIAVGAVGFFCFVAGLVAVLLPRKRHANVA